MNQRRRNLALAGSIVVALVVGLGSGVFLDRHLLLVFVPPSHIPPEAVPQFQLMAEAWNVIQRAYVDRAAIQPRSMGDGAISGMVNALGDTGHSRFLTPQMAVEQHQFTQGEFQGIGAHVQMKDGHVVITAPMDGSPAQESGLKPGDIILKVDGESVAGLPLDEVVGRVMGPPGSSVTLTILSPNTGGTRDIAVTRARISVQNVTWSRVPGTVVAHVRILAFSKGVAQDLQAALNEVQKQELSGLVLDLRSDPGGLLDEAVGTTSQFLRQGNVLLEKDAQGQVTPVSVKTGGAVMDLPMVVLVNEGTASAAEIVAGALQDAERAQLVGETTFGTGTVLGEFSLSDGSVLFLATKEWLTPNGRVIWHQGLAPDVKVSLAPEASLLFPLAERGLTVQELQDSGDVQLLQALDLLAGG